MKIGAIVQARMGSTRLPGKVLMKIKDKTVLEHVVNRLKHSKKLDMIIVATTKKAIDDPVAELCRLQKISLFRGSEINVLERFYMAAKQSHLDVIVRVTSDCPLIDYQVLDQTIEKHLNNTFAITTNAGLHEENRTFPRGLDVEVFNFEYLEKAYINATEIHHKEHVTPYLYENYPNRVGYFKNQVDYSYHRWTLDTSEDFKLIELIYRGLYNSNNQFLFEDILEFFQKNPTAIDINRNVSQKKIY